MIISGETIQVSGSYLSRYKSYKGRDKMVLVEGTDGNALLSRSRLEIGLHPLANLYIGDKQPNVLGPLEGVPNTEDVLEEGLQEDPETLGVRAEPLDTREWLRLRDFG